MAPLSRFEISGSELIEADEKVSLLFEKIGWGHSLVQNEKLMTKKMTKIRI